MILSHMEYYTAIKWSNLQPLTTMWVSFNIMNKKVPNDFLKYYTLFIKFSNKQN